MSLSVGRSLKDFTMGVRGKVMNLEINDLKYIYKMKDSPSSDSIKKKTQGHYRLSLEYGPNSL